MSKDFNKTFKNQFPGSEKDKDGKAIKFESQDSNYRVYYPTFKSAKDNSSYEMDMELDHIRGGGKNDDHGTVNLITDGDGLVTSYKHNVELADNGVKSVIEIAAKAPGLYFKVVEKVAPLVAGVVVAAVTAEATPVGQAIAGSITDAAVTTIVKIEAKMVSIVFSAFGALSDKLQDLSDGGGRDYFPMVVTHSTLRCHNSQMIYLNDGKIIDLMKFDISKFQDAVDSDKDTKSVDNVKSNEALEFKNNDHKYRVWKPDTTVSYSNSHIVLSCKVDGIRDGKQDDHVLIIAAFDCNKNLIAARLTMTMENEDTQTLPAIVMNTEGKVVEVQDDADVKQLNEVDVKSAIEKQLKNALKDMSHYDKFEGKRKNTPELAKDILKWMGSGISS